MDHSSSSSSFQRFYYTSKSGEHLLDLNDEDYSACSPLPQHPEILLKATEALVFTVPLTATKDKTKDDSWCGRRVSIFHVLLSLLPLWALYTSTTVNLYTLRKPRHSSFFIPPPPSRPSEIRRHLLNDSHCTNTFPSPPPFPGKKGIGLTLRPAGQPGDYLTNLPKVMALLPHWNYKWGLSRIDQQPDSIEFVPMMWGGGTHQLPTEIGPDVEAGKIHRLMGFNEPDRPQQSNIAVADALLKWPDLEVTGLPLLSPSCANPRGDWMMNFMEGAVSRCYRIDWVGVHWYGASTNPQGFKNYLKSVYDLYGKPLVITEFAMADFKAPTPADNRHSPEEVLDFMKDVLPWMEAQDWVSGYSWFAFDIAAPQGWSSALFDASGDLTTLGRFYRSVSSSNPSGDQSIGNEPSQSVPATPSPSPFATPEPTRTPTGLLFRPLAHGTK